MVKVLHCEYKHDKKACFDCPYMKMGHPDCIDGVKVKKKTTAEQDAKAIINKKYNNNPESVEKRRKRSLDYKHRNKEAVYRVNEIYRDNHKEDVRRNARKWARIKSLNEGSAKMAGTAMIKGKEIIIYKGKKLNTFWYVFGKEYHEIAAEEVIWLWVKRVAV